MLKKKLVRFAVITTLVCGLTACGNKKAATTATAKTTVDKKDDAGKVNSIYDDPEVEKKLEEINLYVDLFYYNEVDREKQEEALYDGIMQGLDDPYAGYYTPEEFEELQEDSSGEYVGIGAVLTQDTDKIISVVRPIKGSPAEEAGVLAEDIIVEVDGQAVDGQELEIVVKWIRGENNTTAHIKVFRPSVQDYVEMDIPRRVVQNLTVDSEMLDDQIGYIKVDQFNDNTDEEFAEQLDALCKQTAKGIIIDMRDNPGGLVTSAVNMCNSIMSEGVIVSTKDRDGRQTSCYEADAKDSCDLPIVVLVNANSASSSEIFSGAMQDTGKATLVGVQTYGKGVVQSVIPLSDGSAIKLTVSKYYTPNENDIHTVGITPDIIVELPDGREQAVDLPREEDVQLDKAIEVLKEKMANR